jgi:hypothetical protein
MKLVAYLLPLVAIIVYLGFDATDNVQRLQSCVGVVVILVLLFIFSRYPRQVRVTFSISVCIDVSKVIP